MSPIFLCLLLLLCTTTASNFRTENDEIKERNMGSVIVLHGMGDSCLNPGMENVVNSIQNEIGEKVAVKCIMIGNGLEEDTLYGFTMTMGEQTRRLAESLQVDPDLREPLFALGFSQGNLLIRAYIQKYSWRDEYPQVKSFISIHGPLLGVSAIPKCNPNSHIFGYLCEALSYITADLAYTSVVQNNVAQSNYYRDPEFIDQYMTTDFLPPLNFETVNKVPLRGLENLDSLVLVKALSDRTVEPRESEWFGMYADGDYTKILKYNETMFYRNDMFGLRSLQMSGKIHFETTPGDHMEISVHELQRLLRKYWL